MNIEFKCPQCGNAVSVDESYRGQVVECPHCAKGIVVPKAKANSEAVQRPESNMVHIQCPHCGTEYEATQQDMYRLVSCEICGKNFVAGTTSRKQNAGAAQTRPTVHTAPQRSAASRQNQMPRSRPFIAIGNATPEPCTRNPKLTIWIAASAACMAVILATVFILGRYSGKSDSPATAVTMVKSEDGDKQKGCESTISTGNKVSGELLKVSTCKNGTYHVVSGRGSGNLLLRKKDAEFNASIRCSTTKVTGQPQGNSIEPPCNNELSLESLKLCAEQGNPEAQFVLGRRYDNGEGVNTNHLEAAKWFRKAAEQGYVHAQYMLGLCYYLGEGVEADKKEAVNWFRKGAEQGLVDAQYELGACYYYGEGVEKDEVEAIKWFRKAAEQGCADALYDLGKCYYEGIGVAEDATMALNLFREAADKGHAEAQNEVKVAISRQKTDTELIEAFNAFRKEHNGDLAFLISMFCVKVGVWDRRHAKDVLRNSLRNGRRLEEMSEEERKEYMKSTEYNDTNGRISVDKSSKLNITSNVGTNNSERRAPIFAGHSLGDRYDGVIKIDPRTPKAFIVKCRLGKDAGPFVGLDAEFGYTPKTKRLAYVAIHVPCNPLDVYTMSKEVEGKLYDYCGIHGEWKEYYEGGKKSYGYFGINGQYNIGSAFERYEDQDLSPYGVRLNGIIYGVCEERRRREGKIFACVADIELLNTLENEIIEIQDAAIAKIKKDTAAATLYSFCGIKFGDKCTDTSGESLVLIDGVKYSMAQTRMRCNKFRFFSEREMGRAQVWQSRNGNVFRIYMKPGERAISMKRDGTLSKEAETVLAILTKKYGSPFSLKDSSRYNIVERRSEGKVFMFPVGYSGVYLNCTSWGQGLYCMNDVWAKKAIESIAQSKKINLSVGYDVFASGDFLGFKFGGNAPAKIDPYFDRRRTARNKRCDGTISVFISNVARRGQIDQLVKCRKLESLYIGVTWANGKIARIAGSFYPIESGREEFDAICAMCEKKLQVKPQMGKSSRDYDLATFDSGDIVVTVERNTDLGRTQFKAENRKMLRVAKQELDAWREKDDAAQEATLSGVEAL